ncbi:MAG: hypothetical protein EZS28_032899, partial [Streblomastix strix]
MEWIMDAGLGGLGGLGGLSQKLSSKTAACLPFRQN